MGGRKDTWNDRETMLGTIEKSRRDGGGGRRGGKICGKLIEIQKNNRIFAARKFYADYLKYY